MALPDFPRLHAPANWKTLDFISDLHLSAQTPRTFEALLHYLASTPADALFILGDFFDLWIGDDDRHGDFHRRCTQSLAAFAARRSLYFMPGNRDFLVGRAQLLESGMKALADPTVLDAFGQRILLSHGDALCLDDVAYQAFRQEVRSARWQSGFLARPIDERRALAQRIRSESQGRKEAEPDLSKWADVDAAEAGRWLDAAGAQVLVHGHTHRPGDTPLGGARVRMTLTDWDLDGPPPARAEVLRLHDEAVWRRLPISVHP